MLASSRSNDVLWRLTTVVVCAAALIVPAYIVLEMLPPAEVSAPAAQAPAEEIQRSVASTRQDRQETTGAVPLQADPAPAPRLPARQAALQPVTPNLIMPVPTGPAVLARTEPPTAKSAPQIMPPIKVERPSPAIGSPPAIGPAAGPAPGPKASISEWMTYKSMEKRAPIMLRIFKQEAELEVWKRDRSGSYALLKTYPICRWSGLLGPKVKTGDLQSPEGFYAVTPAAMNPNSSYHLSFNLGFPNAYDRAHGRSGSFLMVHGDCKSVGCYAMTNAQITEIYQLATDAFEGGQAAFQVQAYPFRMTPQNFAKHRNSPHVAFWQNLKEGHDLFEMTRQPPQIQVCNRQYGFGSSCGADGLPQAVVAKLTAKRKADEKTASALSWRTFPAPRAAAAATREDGGTHPSFAGILARLAASPR